MKSNRKRRRSIVRAINPDVTPEGFSKGRDFIRANARRPKVTYVSPKPSGSLSGKVAEDVE